MKFNPDLDDDFAQEDGFLMGDDDMGWANSDLEDAVFDDIEQTYEGEDFEIPDAELAEQDYPAEGAGLKNTESETGSADLETSLPSMDIRSTIEGDAVTVDAEMGSIGTVVRPPTAATDNQVLGTPAFQKAVSKVLDAVLPPVDKQWDRDSISIDVENLIRNTERTSFDGASVRSPALRNGS